MKHTITRQANRIDIELTGFAGESFPLFARETACKPLHQTCGRDVYRTLDSITATAIPGGINLTVAGLAHVPLDIHEAERCVEQVVEYILADRCEQKQVL